MRTTILFLTLCMTTCILAQTQPPQAHPKKILTPDQVAYQQQMNIFWTELRRLRAAAKGAYAVEMAREKAGDCTNARTTLDINMCLSHEDDVTAANYKAFTTALRATLALPMPVMPGEDTAPLGPSGRAATPATDTTAFDDAEAAWQTYVKAECAAVDVHWRGGTIVNSMVGECYLRITRARMDELASDYMGILDQ